MPGEQDRGSQLTDCPGFTGLSTLSLDRTFPSGQLLWPCHPIPAHDGTRVGGVILSSIGRCGQGIECRRDTSRGNSARPVRRVRRTHWHRRDTRSDGAAGTSRCARSGRTSGRRGAHGRGRSKRPQLLGPERERRGRSGDGGPERGSHRQRPGLHGFTGTRRGAGTAGRPWISGTRRVARPAGKRGASGTSRADRGHRGHGSDRSAGAARPTGRPRASGITGSTR